MTTTATDIATATSCYYQATTITPPTTTIWSVDLTLSKLKPYQIYRDPWSVIILMILTIDNNDNDDNAMILILMNQDPPIHGNLFPGLHTTPISFRQGSGRISNLRKHLGDDGCSWIIFTTFTSKVHIL